MVIDGYILGWVFIFISLLISIHVLSKYTREIFLWTLKISIALIITLWLVLAVYISENLDFVALTATMDRVYEKLQELRASNPGL